MRFIPCESYSKDWMIFHTPFIMVVLPSAPLTAYAHDSHQKLTTGARITAGTSQFLVYSDYVICFIIQSLNFVIANSSDCLIKAGSFIFH
jgi:hypothetical protein